MHDLIVDKHPGDCEPHTDHVGRGDGVAEGSEREAYHDDTFARVSHSVGQR